MSIINHPLPPALYVRADQYSYLAEIVRYRPDGRYDLLYADYYRTPGQIYPQQIIQTYPDLPYKCGDLVRKVDTVCIWKVTEIQDIFLFDGNKRALQYSIRNEAFGTHSVDPHELYLPCKFNTL